jgi:tyrosinase
MNAALIPLRLPYWDAAAVPPMGTGSFPWVLQKETIQIELPDGTGSTKAMIPNPLYSYTFDPAPTKDMFASSHACILRPRSNNG